MKTRFLTKNLVKCFFAFIAFFFWIVCCPGIYRGYDASFIYNKGAFRDHRSDSDFKLVAAHEFGHSVLMYAGGLSLSWGHKGSTNPITQSVKSTTPGYPKKGSIDLMRYYDWEKSRADFSRRIRDTIAMEVDVKRLIWGAQFKWVK